MAEIVDISELLELLDLLLDLFGKLRRSEVPDKALFKKIREVEHDYWFKLDQCDEDVKSVISEYHWRKLKDLDRTSVETSITNAGTTGSTLIKRQL